MRRAGPHCSRVCLPVKFRQRGSNTISFRGTAVTYPIDTSRCDRIASLDALRGLTVLAWLLSAVVTPLLYQWSGLPLTKVLAAQLSPSFWNGITLDDLVLPMFLFVAGASIVPAFERRRGTEYVNRRLAIRILRRLVLLLAIGILCESELFQHWRFIGAFQRIAICYAMAACLELTTGWRLHAGILLFLPVDYWAILAFGSHGGWERASSIESNAAASVHQLLLPGRKSFGTWDPDGILTTIPAVAVTIAGLLAGRTLIAARTWSVDRSLWFAGIGIVAVNAGFAGNLIVPVNPHLWTLTLCLIALGFGSMLLGLFHATLDVRSRNAWAGLLTALGRNSLLLVLATDALMNAGEWAAQFAGPSLRSAFNPASPAWALILFFIIAMIAFSLDRRRIYATA